MATGGAGRGSVQWQRMHQCFLGALLCPQSSGGGDEMAHSSLRFGIGRFTTAEEVDRAVALTVQHVQKLREMSPLWEMVQEGIDINSIQWSSH